MENNDHTDNSQQPTELCDCDVEDKEKLALYRNKRTQWIQWLSKDEFHSVQTQIDGMLWDDALYRIIIQIPKSNPHNDMPDIGYNVSFFDLFAYNFFETQSMKIRRLVEPLKEQTSKSIISLRALIEDIEKNVSLITRENYVCYDGFKYDSSELHQCYINKQQKEGNKPWLVPLEIRDSQRRHKAFDDLSGTNERNQLRTNTIDKAKIHQLINFKECRTIQKYVNKFVAHAAASENRPHFNLEDINPTLDKFDACYKEIANAAKKIGSVVGDGIAFQVPTPQFDLFENLDKPMANKAIVKKIQEHWEERVRFIDELDRYQHP